MKKLSILLISLIIGISTTQAANPDFYLAGSCNSWTPNNPTYKFSESNGIYTLSLPSLSGDFKITTSNWSLQYGCAQKIEYGKDLPVIQSGDSYNIILPDSPAKNVLITFDYTNKTIRFDHSMSLYLIGDFTDWTLLPTYQFEYQNGLYTLTVPSFSGNFKVVSNDGNHSLGGAGTVIINKEMLMAEGGANMTFAGDDKNAIIKITVNPESMLSDSPAEDPVEDPSVEDPEEENPETPDTPDTPENPDTPDIPDTPGSPDTPDTPDSPTTPDIPETPDTPNSPETPETPDIPDTPETPDIPSNPETPDTDDNTGNGDIENPDSDDNTETEIPETPEDTETPENPDSTEDTGIDGITADPEEVYYYNLSGFRVEHPSGGLFIRRQGNTVSKIFIP